MSLLSSPFLLPLSLSSCFRLSSRIDYAKKKDKRQLIQFRKDEMVVRNDVYKSHVVSVGSGEPPNSRESSFVLLRAPSRADDRSFLFLSPESRPAARRLPGVVRPITQGKLLRKGGPSTPHPSVSLLRFPFSLDDRQLTVTSFLPF